MPRCITDARIAHLPPDRVRQISDYSDVRAAILCEPPFTGLIHGRTTVEMGDGLRVVLVYPIKTVNVDNTDKSMWQMDAGPLCLPCARTPAHTPLFFWTNVPATMSGCLARRLRLRCSKARQKGLALDTLSSTSWCLKTAG